MTAIATDHRTGSERSWRRSSRLAIAAAVAVGAAIVLLYRASLPGGLGLGRTDFDQIWFAARALVHGTDPYTVIGPGRPFPLRWPLVYPLTTVVAVIPLAFTPLLLARVLFVSLGAGSFTYAILAGGPSRLPVLLSYAFLNAVAADQWTPLLAAGLVLPALAWTLPLKPNVGLGVAIGAEHARTLVIAGASALVLLVVSLVVEPHWIGEWRAAVARAPHLIPPIAVWGGPLVLLALLRWRRWDARLLVAYACMPHTPLVYEVLPLGLVAGSFRESLVFALLTNLAFALQALLVDRLGGDPAVWSARILNVTVYLPCLVLVLRRPNVGAVPFLASRTRGPAENDTPAAGDSTAAVSLGNA